MVNPFLFQFVLNCIFILLPAFVVETRLRRLATIVGVIVGIVAAGLSYYGYSILANVSAVYTGSASISLVYLGMLLVEGPLEKFLRNWTVIQKVLYFLLSGLLLLQMIVVTSSFNEKAVAFWTSLFVGCAIPVLFSSYGPTRRRDMVA